MQTMILRSLIRVWWSSSSNVIKHHGCCRCTSSQANVHENLRELYKKFSKPKQPINPFIRFLVKYKPLFVAKYPTAGLYELCNRIAAVWFQLTPDIKMQYYDQFWNDTVVYYKFMDEFRNDVSEEKKRFWEVQKELRDELREKKNQKFLKKVLKKPKRTSNAFVYYVTEKLATSDRKQEITLIDFIRKAANEWSLMSEEDKKKYVDLSKKEFEKYQNEIVNWECDIIKKGYAHFLPKHKFFDTLPSNRDRRKKIRCNEDSCDKITDIYLDNAKLKLCTKY